MSKLHQVWNGGKTTKLITFTQIISCPSFWEVLRDTFMALIYYLHGYFFYNLKIKIWMKLKNILTPRGWYGLLFSTPGPLGGARVPPSAKWSGGQDCWGKIEGLKLSFFSFFYYELDPLRIFEIPKSRKRRTYSTHSLNYGLLWKAVITFAGSAKDIYIQGDKKKWPL